ncbi:MAG: peptidoglycan -binding protein [Proteobacteria bacterium]|nr:peptidoglycan -binding protein [Pseudomonadota bacterium]
MAAITRRTVRSTNIWPGFVDALASVLIVILFLLMVFALTQFFLNEAISGRDTALQKLQNQVVELSELLGLERRESDSLRFNVAQLTEELQASVTRTDDLNAGMRALTLRAETAEGEAKRLTASLEDAFKTIEADKAKIEVRLRELSVLTQDVAALRALREDLERKIIEMTDMARERDSALSAMTEERERSKSALAEERKLSDSARAQMALLNKQLAALREQLAQISVALDVSEALAKKQNVQIASLGKRLNAALATKVQELSRYRSEFFGRLREVLGGQKGVRIVGDRFVFQSEVLFTTGSAELGPAGREQMTRLAGTLKEISARIPGEIDWLLRVDGHTDKVPISTSQYPSNWELSSARALSVVKHLIDLGIPPTRLAAAGFGEFHPLDPRDDEIAYRRNRRIELKLTQR